jgi:hypothetical protein
VDEVRVEIVASGYRVCDARIGLVLDGACGAHAILICLEAVDDVAKLPIDAGLNAAPILIKVEISTAGLFDLLRIGGGRIEIGASPPAQRAIRMAPGTGRMAADVEPGPPVVVCSETAPIVAVANTYTPANANLAVLWLPTRISTDRHKTGRT